MKYLHHTKSFSPKTKLIFGHLVILLFFTHPALAQTSPPVQNPPVNTEVLLSNRGMGFQMTVNKKFQSVPRLGFFSVTDVLAEWESRELSDLMTQAHLTVEAIKNVRVNFGYHLTPQSGFNPTIGLMYSHATPEWLVVVNPRVDLSATNNVEGFAQVEFKPPINKQWRLYSRLQALYGGNPTDNEHTRSYLKLRLGLTFQEFSFGVGSNIDYYGPGRRNENSLGGFFRVLLH